MSPSEVEGDRTDGVADGLEDRRRTDRPADSPSILKKLLSADGLGYAAVQSVLLQLLATAANLCTGVITARLLGASGRGLYAAATTWPSLLGMVATAGSGTAVLIYLRRRPDASPAVAAWGATVALGLSTVLAGVAFVAMPVLLGQHNGAALDTARAALVFAHITALGVVYRCVFSGRGRFLFTNLASLLPALLYAVAASAFAISGTLTVQTAVVSVVLGAAASLVLLFPFLLREVRGRLTGLREANTVLRDFALRAAPADLLALCAGWADRLILILLLIPRDLGLYVVAYGFSRVVTVATPATGLLLSAMSEGEVVSAKNLHDMALRFSIATLSVVLIAVYLLAEPLLTLFYGAEFLAAVVIFKILALQAVAGRIATVTSQLYLASNRPALNSCFSFVDVAVSASLMIVLTPHYGAKGAAIGLLAGTAVRLALLWTCLVTHLRLSFPRLWPSPDDVRAVRALLNS